MLAAKMTRRFTFVFFDATDTLLRVRGSVGAVYSTIAARHGLAVAPDAIDAGFRRALAGTPPLAFPNAPPGAHAGLERSWWRDVARQTFADLGPFPAFDAFFAEAFELFRTAAPWELLPGARETVLQLRAEERRLGIISDTDARLLDVLEALGLRSAFECIALSSRLGASKRDGALFPAALALAGVSAHDAVHVGDTLRADVEGARSAGITPIYFDAARHGDAPPGVATVHDLREVPARLSELERHALL
jgi:putative hydrolase of the HAD superfamily